MANSKDELLHAARVGWAALAALIIVAAVWLYSSLMPRAPQTEVERPPKPSAGSADRPLFRSDAWFLPDDELLGFVEVPAGPFLMGSDKAVDPLAFDNERWSDTRAQGTVDLPVYYVGRYEVTVAEFKAFTDATGLRTDEQTLRAAPDHPVTSVSWPDALAYCRWLETALRKWPETPPRLRQLLHDGWRVSLPSEAEWEKAARGTSGRIFPWGNEPRRDRSNYAGAGTTPVGAFDCPECPFGLLDMSGNVWEWTRSPYQPYPYDERDDRAHLDADALWVMRGGHFGDPSKLVRAATRGAADPGARRAFMGFRVAIARLGAP